MIDQFLQYIGQLVLYGGGLVAIAYAAFRLFAVKWLDNKFAERLAAFKHEQAKELEKVRFEFKSLFDRLTKFYQKEYEVLPEAWIKLNNSYWKAASLLSPLQSYPDLNKMNALQLEEFIQSCKLEEWEKAELLRTEQKQEFYMERISWHELSEAINASKECHIYLETNGIFLKPELKEKFSHIDDLIWRGIRDEETRKRYGSRKERVDLQKEVEPLVKELETDVQRMLRE